MAPHASTPTCGALALFSCCLGSDRAVKAREVKAREVKAKSVAPVVSKAVIEQPEEELVMPLDAHVVQKQRSVSDSTAALNSKNNTETALAFKLSILLALLCVFLRLDCETAVFVLVAAACCLPKGLLSKDSAVPAEHNSHAHRTSRRASLQVVPAKRSSLIEQASSRGGSSTSGVLQMVNAGVPQEMAEGVAALGVAVGSLSVEGSWCKREPLCDPLTLLRFYNARERDVGAAAEMHKASVAWRAENIPVTMAAHGNGADYVEGTSSLAGPWMWRRDRSVTPEAELVARHGFFGRLDVVDSADGAPVAVWRIGSADFAGLKREGLEEAMLRGMVSHMEDLLQSGRAASYKQRKLVRARLVIDLSGAGLWLLRHREFLQSLGAVGKRCFPEVSASCTIIRAPWVVARLYAVAEPLLTPTMRLKVRILGEEFCDGLLQHSGIKKSALPVFLGGATADGQIGAAEPVPVGAGTKLS